MPYQKFDRLMAAEDWRNPEDVIEPQNVNGLDLEELLALAHAQLAREQDEDRRRRLGGVREKLLRYVRLEQLEKKLAAEREQKRSPARDGCR